MQDRKMSVLLHLHFLCLGVFLSLLLFPQILISLGVKHILFCELNICLEWLYWLYLLFYNNFVIYLFKYKGCVYLPCFLSQKWWVRILFYFPIQFIQPFIYLFRSLTTEFLLLMKPMPGMAQVKSLQLAVFSHLFSIKLNRPVQLTACELLTWDLRAPAATFSTATWCERAWGKEGAEGGCVLLEGRGVCAREGLGWGLVFQDIFKKRLDRFIDS